MQAVSGGLRVGVRASGDRAEERREAFERLTQARLRRAYRLASMLLSDTEEAQDAVHDAAEQAWRGQRSLRDLGRFDAWFDAIVVNRCRDRLRRRRTQPLVPDALNEAVGRDPLACSAERLALASALERLAPDHRIVVALRYAADLSIAEIAARTGEREGTVKSRLHCGLRELRAAYDAADRPAGGNR
jgi:RNA polymerase sigma-70 factor (ECF subfamily)